MLLQNHILTIFKCSICFQLCPKWSQLQMLCSVYSKDTVKSSLGSLWCCLCLCHTKQSCERTLTRLLFTWPCTCQSVHMHRHRYTNTHNELTMNPLHPRRLGMFLGTKQQRLWLTMAFVSLCVCVFFVCLCSWIHSKHGNPMTCETWSSSIPRVTSTWWSASRSYREGGVFDLVSCSWFLSFCHHFCVNWLKLFPHFWHHSAGYHLIVKRRRKNIENKHMFSFKTK